MFFSFVIGLSQGLQPIASYNYGAGKFDRVKSAYKKSILCGFTMCIIAFAMFQIFPRQIISIFGKGDETYYRFAINYFRIFLFCTCVNCLQPITSTFLTAIGKPKGGMFLSAYKTDNIFTSTDCNITAYYGNRWYNVCGTDSWRTCGSCGCNYDKERIFRGKL